MSITSLIKLFLNKLQHFCNIFDPTFKIIVRVLKYTHKNILVKLKNEIKNCTIFYSINLH